MADSGRYKRVLVPLDGSAWSQRALPHAVEIARSNESELWLLHVFAPPTQVYAPELTLSRQDESADQLRTSMAHYLHTLVEELCEQGLMAHSKLIEHTDVAGAVCDFIRLQHIDMVVMSTHGRTGLSRFFFGSVAKAVMEGTHVPTLLVHPQQEAHAV